MTALATSVTVGLEDLTARVPDHTNEPFKFLDFFEERDALSFAGRDREIQECVDRISTSRLFVLYARSGFGKTSLLKAGLFPPLRKRGLRPVYVRTLKDPVLDVRAALVAEGGIGADTQEDGLPELIRRLPSAGRIVLVLDQFEEFFIRFGKQCDVRKALLETLRDLVLDTKLDLRIVFSLREDYIAQLDDFREALPGLLDGAYRLLPLTAFGAREAITRPLIQRRIRYSPALVTRMVEQLEEVGFDPPLLQIFCTEVYREAISRNAANPSLTDEDLIIVGELDGIFHRYLDTVTQHPVLQAAPLIARNVLDTMLTEDNTKRAVTLADLMSAGFRASQADVEGILDALVARYVVRRTMREDTPWFELIHERLVKYVKKWLDRDAEFLKFRIARNLVTNASRGEYWRVRPDILLNVGQIEGMIKPFRATFNFNPLQIEFVYRSAMVSRSEEAGFWIEQLGRAKGIAILLEALGDSRRELRLGAASVAGVIPDPDRRVAEACQGFINEPDEEIRRAAARSYSRLLSRDGSVSRPIAPPSSATGEATNSLARWWSVKLDALVRTVPFLSRLIRRASGYVPRPDAVLFALIRSLRTRGPLATVRLFFQTFSGTRPDLDYLAARAEQGDPLADVPLWKCFYARWLATEHLQKTQATSIHNHAIKGAVAGLAGGLAWMFTIGITTALFGEYLSSGSARAGATGISSAIGFLYKYFTPGFVTGISSAIGFLYKYFTPGFVLLAGSGFLGYFTALANARGALLSASRFRPLLMARSHLLLAVFGGFVLCATDEWGRILFAADSPTTGRFFGDVNSYLTYNLFLVVLVFLSPEWNRSLRLGLVVIVASILAYLGLREVSRAAGFGGLFTQVGYLTLYFLIFSVLLGAGLAISEAMIQLTQWCVNRSAESPRRIAASLALWVFANCVSLPLLFLAVVNLPLNFLTHRWATITQGLAVALSYLIAVSVPARWYANRVAPLPQTSPLTGETPSRPSRRASLAALALAPLAFYLMWGFDTLRWFPKSYDLLIPGPRVIRLPVGPAARNLGLAKLSVGEDAVVRVVSSSGPLNELRFDDSSTSSKASSRFPANALYFFPRGDHRLILTRQSNPLKRYPSPVETAELILERENLPDANGIAVPRSGRTPCIVHMRRIPTGGWRGQIAGDWSPDANSKSRPLVRLSNLASDSFGFADLQIEGAESVRWTGKANQTTHSFNVGPATTIQWLNENTDARLATNVPLVLPVFRDGKWSVKLSGEMGSQSTSESESGLDELWLYVSVEAIDESRIKNLFPVETKAFAQGTEASTLNRASDKSASLSAREAIGRAQTKVATIQSAATRNSQEWDEVVSLYHQALRAGEDGADLHCGLSNALKQSGDLGAAIDEGREALKRNPTNPDYSNTLAWHLCLAGRYGEAYPIARGVADHFPREVNYQDILAHAAYHTGRWREAVDAWDRVLANAPQYFDDRSHVNCGDDRACYDNARRHLAEAQLDATFPDDPFGPPP